MGRPNSMYCSKKCGIEAQALKISMDRKAVDPQRANQFIRFKGASFCNACSACVPDFCILLEPRSKRRLCLTCARGALTPVGVETPRTRQRARFRAYVKIEKGAVRDAKAREPKPDTAAIYRDRYRTDPEFRRSERRRTLKRRATPKGRIYKRIGELIRTDLKRRGSLSDKKRRTWTKLLGYTPLELRQHLEAQFTDGMTWKAFMKGEIHIDHIRPVASFQYSSVDDEQFKQCWSLNNLQPLWAKDNIAKSSNWNGKSWRCKTF